MSSLADATDQQRHCSEVPHQREPVETEAEGTRETPTTASDVGAAPDTRSEQCGFLIEEYEMEGESAGDNLAVAETTLARLLVKLWRARQAGRHERAAK